MSALVNVDGNWINIREIWVKSTGIWKLSAGGYFKIAGVWTLVQTPPGPPPQGPIISLEVGSTKHITVGVTYPGSNDDPSIEQIRVLVSRTAMPTNQFGSGAIAEPDITYPDETWSDFWYANHTNAKGVVSVHPSTAQAIFKKYPPNSTGETPPLPGGQYYYFAGWTKDVLGQWSVGTFTKVFVPTGAITGSISKEANFLPNDTGTLVSLTGVTWVPASNDMAVAGNASKGVAFFGNNITTAIGQDGTPQGFNPTVRLTRDSDTGSPTANVWAFWHDVVTPGDVALGHQFDKANIGTIAKGQTKTFTLPASWDTHWNNDIKGIGFGWSSTPVIGDNSTLLGQDRDPRAAEINIKWTEAS